MASAYQIGKAYRSWWSTEPNASNTAVRSALEDFTVGSNVSLALIYEVATSRVLRSINTSESQRPTIERLNPVVGELRKTYNSERIKEALRFLEGFSGLAEGELTPTDQNIIENISRGREAAAQRKRVTTSRELYVEGAKFAIGALGRVETYILYIIFLGAIDWITAWNSTVKPDDWGWGLMTISSNLWVWYGGGLVLTFNYLTGAGNSIQQIGTQEFLSRCWRSYKASFVAGIYILGGLLLLIAPGIILAIRYMFVGLISILEGGSIESCLEKSKQLAVYVRWSVVNATALSFLTYVASIVAIGMAIGEEATKTLGYNLAVAGSGTLWGIWLSGIVYSGYRKALSRHAIN